MEREIKFRAWSTADKKMYEPAYFDNLEVGWWNENDGLTEILGDRHENSMLHQVILMQFTGLKDKNGKDVYEGDVVRHDAVLYKEVGSVVFCEGAYELVHLDGNFLCHLWSDIEERFEVIGNIHEDKP